MQPRLIIVETQKPARNLGSVTWEQRRKMTAEQLIDLMGELHVNHPDYVAKPVPLNPTPNFTGKQLCLSGYKATMWAELKRNCRWLW